MDPTRIQHGAQATKSSIIQDDSLFGHLAAEEEKELIATFFQETDSFRRIYHGDKYIVLGRKGSGKSAIFLYLERKVSGEGGNIANISLEQYPTQVFSKLRDIEVDITEAHTKTWKFVLLLTLMDLYTRFAQRTKLRDPNIAAYERFLKTHLDYNVERNMWDRVLTFLKTFRSIDVSVLGIGAGLQFDPSNLSKEDFGHRIHIVNAKLEDLLKQSLGQHSKWNPGELGQFFVSLDRLDEQWRNNEETNALLVGLLKAVRNLNLDIPRARFIVFLRSDVYEQLRYQNKAHISEYIERLTWTKELLEQMIARRIAAHLHIGNGSDEWFTEQMWGQVFTDLTAKYGTSGKQMVRNFISTRSFNRPRDYISMLKALQQVSNQYELPRIHPEVPLGGQRRNISVEAERIYSERVYQEFQDELQDQMPNFDKVMDTIRNEIGYFSFGADEFGEALGRTNIEGDYRSVLLQMFEFSIIGFHNPGGKDTVTGRVGARGDEYRYLSDTLQFEINTGQFKIHPSLRRYLNLAEKRNARQNGSPRNQRTGDARSGRGRAQEKVSSIGVAQDEFDWDFGDEDDLA